MQDRTQLPGSASARSEVKINFIFIISSGSLVNVFTLFGDCFRRGQCLRIKSLGFRSGMGGAQLNYIGGVFFFFFFKKQIYLFLQKL